MPQIAELSPKYSGALKRISWALNRPLNKTLEQIIESAVNKMDPRKICRACRDNSFCANCLFNQGGGNEKNHEL